MAVPIEVKNLTKYYGIGKRGMLMKALDGVSFCLNQNEILGLLGANGAGKSTTIKILVGAVKPSIGHALICGQKLSKQLKRKIGYLPESPYFYKFLTGFELVNFYAKLSGMKAKDAKDATEKALEIVGLADAADRELALYSKGMVQRAGLAQAIVHDPEILILDEPASGLDPAGTADMADIILRLKSQGKSILICSHSSEEVQRLCDRVVILSKGKVAACGKLEDLLKKSGQTNMTFETDAPDDIARIESAAGAIGVKTISKQPAKMPLSEFFRRLVK